MNVFSILSLLMVSMFSYADASFNEVRDVIFTPSSHAQNTVEEQEMAVYQHGQLPHYEVKAANFFKDGLNLLKQDVARTLSEKNDYYPRLEKHLHSNGICLTGNWQITADTPYSGYFKKGSQALFIGRASTALTETEQGEARAFGFAGKLFPTLKQTQKVPTANFFTVDVLAGADRDHYLDVKMTNEPKTGFRFGIIPLAFQVGRVFRNADDNPGYRPVDNIAALGVKVGEAVKAPRFLMVQAMPKTPHNDSKDFRDELNIEKHHLPMLAMQIFVSDSSGDQDSKDWKAIGQISLTESKVSYGCDRQLHFAHPKIKK